MARITLSAAGLRIGRGQAGHLHYCRAAAFPAWLCYFPFSPQSCEDVVIPVECCEKVGSGWDVNSVDCKLMPYMLGVACE